MPLSVSDFVQRWKINSLSERSGSQSHFIDLCEMLGHLHPAAADAIGERFTFDKPVSKVYGGYGFADVWLRDHFAWEYKESRKKKHKDLKAAYKQLNDYREDLGNPPLLVVCDMDRFEIHTNFTATSKRVYAFNLDDLLRNKVTAASALPPLEVLRALFGDYNVLRPDRTDAYVTQEAAKVFSRLAERLEIEKRSLTDTPINTREEIAHFLMRILFCLFADSIGLLPDHLFRKLVQGPDRFLPRKFLRKLKSLFEAMSQPDSIFGEHSIKYFNGGLFDSDSVIELDTADLGILNEVSKNYDWSHVAPEIFGTLFERSLNKERRSLIGAHYTSAEDILLLIEPILMRPLERRWAEVKQQLLSTLETERKLAEQASTPRQGRLRNSHLESERILAVWITELTAIRVLDPACGSGNFLYLALRRMLDLWLEARNFAATHNISLVVPAMVSPAQLFGIEIEFYAHELASIVVWIGFLQWKHEHGILEDREPILQKLDNIQHADAILRYNAEGKPFEPTWPKADFIIGNPPFLGDKLMRRELNVEPHVHYVDHLRKLYEDRVPGGADLVTYWFEKSRALIEHGNLRRAGLIATQGIRGGANRIVLERLKTSGNIFFAFGDKDWELEGAVVHVSLVGFDDGSESERNLDGNPVMEINANLSTGLNIGSAVRLIENAELCFIGTQRGGAFDLSPEDARRMLQAPINPSGFSNSDVIKRWMNAADITSRPREMFIIDFGTNMSETTASLYELPFEYALSHIKPFRQTVRRASYRERWWLHQEARPGMRTRISLLARYIATPLVSKHRIFVFVPAGVLSENLVNVIARSDDYFFGVLHCSAHEFWARSQDTQLRDVASGFRYTASTTFDTFPFPWPPGTEPSEAESPIVKVIADAARELVRLRDAWLNPPGIPQSRPQRQDPHQALQPAPHLARQRPPLPRPRRLRRLWLARRPRSPPQTGDPLPPSRPQPRTSRRPAPKTPPQASPSQAKGGCPLCRRRSQPQLTHKSPSLRATAPKPLPESRAHLRS